MKQKNDSSPSTGNKILPLEECLAKTRHDADGNIGPGVNVETHCLATFEVARQLLKYYSHFCTASLWDPPKDLLAPLLHDVGKVSPRFQKKIYSAFQKELPESISEVDTSGENHCATSYKTLDELNLNNLANVVASHHGSFCPVDGHCARNYRYGGSKWEDIREELVLKLIEKCGLKKTDISDEEGKMNLVLGLTILADWLSSGMDLEPGQEPTPEICAEAIKKADFVPFKLQNDRTFKELFKSGDQPGFEPNDVQKTMLENVIKPGGVYVLETEMGSGKTEAALALAYELLKSHKHTGIYFALPTQLTSDKIYERFIPFLEKIRDPEDRNWDPLLLHGKAWLKKKLQEDGDDGFQEKAKKANSWFSDRKRALLAPFAVGTIDQILMSVINVRHNALRALGAAGKVVILDEVHSYDDYTGSLILKLVKFLRKWKCTVIILSATLTQELRNKLLYPEKQEENESTNDNPPPETVTYPLLSIRDENRVFCPEIVQKKIKSKSVKISHEKCICKACQTATEHAENGECVLWIENTVSDAQEVFRRLVNREMKGVEIGLIHSRFQEKTRRENEDEWVDKYGKNASQADRAGGKILVGTQVLEQSVDIDADFLVTRLCPTDMLLQRIGRLWRHESLNPFRPKSAQPKVLILNESPFQNKENGFDHEETPPVYDPYVLMRSQEVFEKRDEIIIPRDMRELIESTYSKREKGETGWYAKLKQELEEKRQKLEALANLSMGTAYGVLPDTEASTRYCEVETVEVLLLEKKGYDKNQIRPFGSKEWIPIPARNAPKQKCIDCAVKLSEYLVRVPIDKAPSYDGGVLDNLGHIFYIGYDKEDRPLRVAFVGDDYVLQNQWGDPVKADPLPGQSESKIKSMSYHRKSGYSYERKENK